MSASSWRVVNAFEKLSMPYRSHEIDLVLAALRCVSAYHRNVFLNSEVHAGLVCIRLHCEENSLPVFLAKPPRFEEWDFSAAVFADRGACPQVSYGRFRHPSRIVEVLQV